MVQIIETNIYDNKTIDIIYHIADIHIHNDTNRYDEYNNVFNNLYKKIDKKDNSIIVIVGDIIHKSSKISPECISLTKQFFLNLSNIAPTILIAGNHDDNIRGSDNKIDSISAIIKDLDYKNLYYFKDTGIYNVGNNISFGVISVFNETQIKIEDFNNTTRDKICLYHGMVQSSIDNKNTIPNGNYKFTSNDFKNYDLVLLGDIHKFSFLNEKKTIAYCGSLIQQNYGEDLINHGGCIKWNLKDKSHTFLEIPNNYGYITINYKNNNLEIPKYYPTKCRIRINYMDETIIPKNEIEPLIKSLLNCEIHDIKLLHHNSCNNIIDDYVNNQNDLLLYLKNNLNLDYNTCDEIQTIHNNEISRLVENVNSTKYYWKLKTIEFEHILCYGKKQQIDFTQLNNLWAIIGKNAQGKSSFVLIILFSLYGKIPDTTKDDIYNKNSKNKKIKTKIELSISDDSYIIKRTINKVTLYKNNINISETHKKDTEDKIIQLIGDLLTLTNTNISLQDRHNILINSDNNNKLKILKKILSLDVFDDIHTSIKYKTQQKQTYYNKLKQELDNDNKCIDNKTTIEQKLLLLLNEKNYYDKCISNYQKKSQYIQLISKKHSIEDKLNTNSNLVLNVLVDTKNKNKILIKELLSKKNNLLREIINIDINNTNINKLNLELDENKLKLNNIIDTIDITKKQIININNNNIELHHNTYMENINNLKIILKELARLNNTIKKNDSKIKQHKFKYNTTCIDCQHNKKHSGLVDLECDYNELINERKQLEIEIDNINKYIDNNNYIELDYKNYNNNIKLNTIIEKKTISKDKLQYKITAILQSIQNYCKYEDTIKKNNNIDIDIDELDKQIEYINTTNDKIDSNILLYNKMENYKNELNSINSDLKILNYNTELDYKPTNIEYENIIKQIGLIENELKNISNIITTIEDKKNTLSIVTHELTNYNIYEKLTNWKGYPLYLIEKKINQLELEINKILSTIVDFECSIKLLNNDKKGGDIIFNKITKNNNNIPIKNASGFEKFILSIAIRIGLITISNYMTPNFMIIDEGFGSMDNTNLSKISDIFENIINKFDTILLITHKEELKEQINNKITINNNKLTINNHTLL